MRPEADDAQVDLVWASLQRGDLEQAEAGAARIRDPDLRERARLDLLAARSGRAAAYLAALEADSWLQARYSASREAALEVLRQQRRLDARRAAVWLEEARRSPTTDRALSSLRAAQALAPGGVEALASRAELLLGQQRYAEAGEALAQPLDGARLRLARARWLASTGRSGSAVRALLQDVQDGLAVPASLSLLHELLAGLPQAELEKQALAVLSGPAAGGWRMERARLRLQAWLLAESGDPAGASACLRQLDPRAPEDDAALLRLQARVDGVVPASALPEARLDADRDRPRGVELAQRRLADEWDLAARQAWDDADEGRGLDLDGFLARLDESALGLPGAPALAALPRRDFGLFGALLEPAPLRAALPGALVVAGKALTLPADIAWFDRQAGGPRDLPEGGTYEEWLVRRPRIGGYLASRGAAITGAGLDPLVWIDLDQLEREERGARLQPCGPP
ncbi:MAG: hypothetical protein FJ296_08105, partial [Planctomycetes bacterium]|nr:hypothetical protein [Planctomycetota bacterium]